MLNLFKINLVENVKIDQFNDKLLTFMKKGKAEGFAFAIFDNKKII